MTADDLDHALAELGMTQSGAARYFGISPRAMRDYIAGKVRVPTVLALALAALRVSHIEPNELRRRAGLDPVDFARPAGRPAR